MPPSRNLVLGVNLEHEYGSSIVAIATSWGLPQMRNPVHLKPLCLRIIQRRAEAFLHARNSPNSVASDYNLNITDVSYMELQVDCIQRGLHSRGGESDLVDRLWRDEEKQDWYRTGARFGNSFLELVRQDIYYVLLQIS